MERDLHDISGRVREYDSDARLVREDVSGQLGLARWRPTNILIDGGYWAFARRMHDLDTDAPLTGEPDARCLRFQRSADSWGRNLRKWHEAQKHEMWMQERRDFDAMSEQNREHAERFVNALKKDVTARPKAFIPAGIPKAA